MSSGLWFTIPFIVIFGSMFACIAVDAFLGGDQND